MNDSGTTQEPGQVSDSFLLERCAARAAELLDHARIAEAGAAKMGHPRLAAEWRARAAKWRASAADLLALLALVQASRPALGGLRVD